MTRIGASSTANDLVRAARAAVRAEIIAPAFGLRPPVPPIEVIDPPGRILPTA